MSVSNSSSVWKTGRQPHVCVIGAGVSGLRCADLLLQSGIKVTILEARDRIGGRVHQNDHLGYYVDMGANWIHGGSKNNPIRVLAEETGTTAIANDDHSTVFDQMGARIGLEKSLQLSEIVWGIIGEAFKYSNEASDIPADRSLKDFFVEKLEKHSLSEEDRKICMHMSEMWGGYIGTPYDRQSLKYLWLESSIDGENLFVASTYQKILQRIAAPVCRSTKIYLSQKVDKISYSAQSSSSSRCISVQTTTDDPSTPSKFDAVIVTIPHGCLHRQKSLFSPSPPKHLKHAISSISYGSLEKVYVTFPKAFWDTPDTQFPFFSHFIHPVYSSSNPNSYDIGMVSESAMPKNTAHPTLLFYVYGPCGAHVTSLITQLKPSDPKYRQRLLEFFEPYYSRLPNYDGSSPDCVPSGVLATDWQHDELAGFGSYTNWQIDTSAHDGTRAKMPLDKAIETMREGMPDRNIWFAGEATAPFLGLGTVTGAYWSGERVSHQVIEAFKASEESNDEDWEVVSSPAQEKARVSGKETAQVGKAMGGHANGIEI